MKYKLISIENRPIINIGDYIQALAASQFLPQIDGFVNREELSDYDGDECQIIMNGWYMHQPDHWPPSRKIHPLFVALHINKLAVNQMLSDSGVDYLKRNEPIGCRDFYTRDKLIEQGIKAYFSGCLTLTLGEKYKSEQKNNTICIVDPTIPSHVGFFDKILEILCLIIHYPSVKKISEKLIIRHKRLNNLIYVSRFYRLYTTLFSKETLTSAKYENQENAYYASLSNEERLREAERLVRQYASARFVITSRIHCALPCLGLETPVYFTSGEIMTEESRCRFGGLIELFNTVIVTKKGLKCSFDHRGKISNNNIIANTDDWRPIAQGLIKKCNDFISH